MKLYFGPLEGLTTVFYRGLHHELFGGVDRYFAPFISPTGDRVFTPRELRELLPENNRGVALVPQLLGKNGGDLLWAVNALADMGYGEVNLNLGCPSATVTAKGKGAGLLRTPEVLTAMLDTVYAGARIPVSVKTRLGYERPEEFYSLLEIYNRYPVSELILHCRTRQEMYAGAVHTEMFDYALANSRAPVCYNGNLLILSDCAGFKNRYPRQEALMLARGPARDPALFRRLRGGHSLRRVELEEFHNRLYGEYCGAFGRVNGMRRMKELWSFWLDMFEGAGELRKRMFRTKDTDTFEDCVRAAFGTLRLKGE